MPKKVVVKVNATQPTLIQGIGRAVTKHVPGVATATIRKSRQPKKTVPGGIRG